MDLLLRWWNGFWGGWLGGLAKIGHGIDPHGQPTSPEAIGHDFDPHGR
jgi:hypothetical protein